MGDAARAARTRRWDRPGAAAGVAAARGRGGERNRASMLLRPTAGPTYGNTYSNAFKALSVLQPVRVGLLGFLYRRAVRSKQHRRFPSGVDVSPASAGFATRADEALSLATVHMATIGSAASATAEAEPRRPTVRCTLARFTVSAQNSRSAITRWRLHSCCDTALTAILCGLSRRICTTLLLH